MQKFEFHHTVNQDNITAINLLSNQLALSVSQIKDAINKGALWHKKSNRQGNKQSSSKQAPQRLRRIKKSLAKGDELYFYYDENVLAQAPNDAILIDDKQDYSVWYKPYGMLCQGSKWSDHCTIARWVQSYFNHQRSCFVVHRLDRATTGLIIIAHTKSCAQQFGKIFEQHALTKRYQAICHGLFTQHKLTVDTKINDKAALSHIQSIDTSHKAQLSLIEVTIETGRKHQIRIHCASVGHPLVGDRLHGNKQADIDKLVDLQLCAKHLAFTCPMTNQQQNYTLPTELQLNWNAICKS